MKVAVRPERTSFVLESQRPKFLGRQLAENFILRGKKPRAQSSYRIKDGKLMMPPMAPKVIPKRI
jgi:hypothetical protein